MNEEHEPILLSDKTEITALKLTLILIKFVERIAEIEGLNERVLAGEAQTEVARIFREMKKEETNQ